MMRSSGSGSHCTGGFERMRTRKRLFSSVMIRRTDNVEKMCSGWNSRRCSKPMTQSTSALLSRTVEMGDLWDEDVADNSGVARICCRRSGDALSKNQWEESEDTAT